MLSVIICAVHYPIHKKIEENIRDTIGCEYELIVIDNSQNRYNIFEAYNLGVERAHGSVLCFMHEDVVYRSSNWGSRCMEYMNDETVGCLCVAGGHVVGDRGDWRVLGYCQNNLIQGFTTIDEQHRYYTTGDVWDHAQKLQDVATVDGVWFCIRRETFSKVRFDDTTFHGFHMYDFDISMQINKVGLRCCVCADIVMEHISPGTYSQQYVDNRKLFDEKWQKDLPCVRGIRLTDRELQEHLDASEKALQRQISNDAVVIELSRKVADYDSLTDRERSVIEQSLWKYAKRHIVHSPTNGGAWKAVEHYLGSRYATRRMTLVFKFVYHRYIDRRSLRPTNY